MNLSLWILIRAVQGMKQALQDIDKRLGTLRAQAKKAASTEDTIQGAFPKEALLWGSPLACRGSPGKRNSVGRSYRGGPGSKGGRYFNLGCFSVVSPPQCDGCIGCRCNV